MTAAAHERVRLQPITAHVAREFVVGTRSEALGVLPRPLEILRVFGLFDRRQLLRPHLAILDCLLVLLVARPGLRLGLLNVTLLGRMEFLLVLGRLALQPLCMRLLARRLLGPLVSAFLEALLYALSLPLELECSPLLGGLRQLLPMAADAHVGVQLQEGERLGTIRRQGVVARCLARLLEPLLLPNALAVQLAQGISTHLRIEIALLLRAVAKGGRRRAQHAEEPRAPRM